MRHSLVLAGTVAASLLLTGSTGCARRVRVAAPTAVAAQPAYYQPQPTTVLFATPANVDQVRAAILRALADRGFQAEGEEAGSRVVARYQRGRMTARVDIQYWSTQATITYLGSEGLPFRDGRSPHYERWTQSLASSMQSRLAELVRSQPTYVVAPATVVVQQPYVQQPAVVVQPQPVIVQPQPVVVQPAPVQPVGGQVVVQGQGGTVQGSATVQGVIIVNP